MNLTYNAAVLLLAVGLFLPTARAGDQRPIVAVFDIQTKFIKLPRAKREALTEVMAEELALGGVYQVMPPGDVKRILIEQSAESYKECFDDRCQIELGRQLPANKLPTTTIKKMAGKCRVTGSLYDLKRQTTDLVAKESTGCSEGGLVKAVESVAAKIRAWQSGSARSAAFVEEDLGEKPAGDWEVGAGNEVIVEFTSEPDGAVVLVDGNLVCQRTPCSKSVGPGAHMVSMQAPSYLKRQERLVVAKGTKFAWKLEPNFGCLTVRSEPAGHAVKINGRAAGTTPIERQEREPGVYKVLVTSACHYDAGKKVRVEKGQERKVEVALKDKQGAVKVKAEDGKGNDIVADVYVDGTKVGRTPGTYKVSVCAKVLEVKSEKHVPVKKELNVRERQVMPVEVVLKGGKAGEVKQPGTNLYWLRCPIGQRWTGSSCKGDARSMKWNRAMKACPNTQMGDGY